MSEAVIRDFLTGSVSAAELEAEATGAFERHTDAAGTKYARMRSVGASGEFEVRPEHLLRLLDAVEAGQLGLEGLEAVCFCLEASDGFAWDADETEDGRRVAEALFLLGSPEINHPLTATALGNV